MTKFKGLDYHSLRRIIIKFRGDRLRALIDAARDVAKGSHDPETELLAKNVVRILQAEGHTI